MTLKNQKFGYKFQLDILQNDLWLITVTFSDKFVNICTAMGFLGKFFAGNSNSNFKIACRQKRQIFHYLIVSY